LCKKKKKCWALVVVILATQEAKIRKIVVQSQPGQIVLKTLSRKKPSQKRAGGITEGVGSEFKPQYWKKKKAKVSSTCCTEEEVCV
jgi:hypothetical protein